MKKNKLKIKGIIKIISGIFAIPSIIYSSTIFGQTLKGQGEDVFIFFRDAVLFFVIMIIAISLFVIYLGFQDLKKAIGKR